MSKKLLCLVLAMIFVVGLLTFSAAADDNIRVFLNDEEIVFDVPPQIINDRTMVPMRATFEALGFDVEWDADGHDVIKDRQFLDTYDVDATTIVASKEIGGGLGKRYVIIQIGGLFVKRTSVWYCGELMSIGSSTVDWVEGIGFLCCHNFDRIAFPQVVNGRTLVPLRTIERGLNADVEWCDDTRTVTITTSEEARLPNIERRDGMYLVYLAQYVAHPALDSVREGFISGLADEGFTEGQNVDFAKFNAHSDDFMFDIAVIEAYNANPDLIFAVGGMAASKLMWIDTIPIVVSAVRGSAWDTPRANVTGTSSEVPVVEQFELLTQLLPNAQTVGIIYDSWWSRTQADEAVEIARTLGLDYVRRSVVNTYDVARVAEYLAERVDVIYVPICHTVMAEYAALITAATDLGIPVIVGERGGVYAGALATRGIDYYQLGRQSAVMAAQILRGEANPQDMPIQFQHYTMMTTTINLTTAELLGITIPDDILANAILVE